MSIIKDDLLRLYAFYNVTNGMRHEPNNRQPIVSAFKVNSIMQATHLLINTAKKSMWGWSINPNKRISPVVWRFAARFD